MNHKCLAADVAAYLAVLATNSVVSRSHFTLASLYNKYGVAEVDSEVNRQILTHETELVDGRQSQDSQGTST